MEYKTINEGNIEGAESDETDVHRRNNSRSIRNSNKKLKNRRSPDLEKIPTELLKYEENMLKERLLAFFTIYRNLNKYRRTVN
jgi:hypothetical protein